MRGKDRVAVAFSGGIDSVTVAACAKSRTDVVLCSAFADGSHDERKSEEAARTLGLEHVVVRLSREMADDEIGELRLPFQATLMDRGLWCLYSVVARSAKESGAQVILLGQLADELFGGYSKYEAALDKAGESGVELMMTADVDEYQSRGRVRDIAACSRWLEPRFPFNADDVVDLGLSFPVSFKLRGGVRKAVLRRAASIVGVPDELTQRAKKAAQYSSGVQKLLR